MVAMPIVVMPQTVMSLTEFLASHDLTLAVRQTGADVWEASFEPDLVERLGEEDDDDASPIVIQGSSSQEAIQEMCLYLSGRDMLYIDNDDDNPVDLYYTKVENDGV